jgi:hypothetical protein
MKTKLGEQLMAIRLKAIDSGMALKDLDELFPSIEGLEAELTALQSLVREMGNNLKHFYLVYYGLSDYSLKPIAEQTYEILNRTKVKAIMERK